MAHHPSGASQENPIIFIPKLSTSNVLAAGDRHCMYLSGFHMHVRQTHDQLRVSGLGSLAPRGTANTQGGRMGFLPPNLIRPFLHNQSTTPTLEHQRRGEGRCSEPVSVEEGRAPCLFWENAWGCIINTESYFILPMYSKP